MFALTGPVWGFLGALAGVVGGLVTTLAVAVYNKRHDDPHVEQNDELAGLKASVDALLPVVAGLRVELTASEAKHEECLRALAEKSTQITNLSIELLRFHQMLQGKQDRPGSPA